MTNNPTLHLIIGKWRTQNHSTKKELDDAHKVKEEILKKVGRGKFSKKVGENPDLDITREGIVILKGKEEFKRRPYYVTDISADEHFVMRFVPKAQSSEIETQIFILNLSDKEDKTELHFIAHFHRMYIIPNNEKLISALIDTLTEEYLVRASGQEEDVIVLLSDTQN